MLPYNFPFKTLSRCIIFSDSNPNGWPESLRSRVETNPAVVVGKFLCDVHTIYDQTAYRYFY